MIRWLQEPWVKRALKGIGWLIAAVVWTVALVLAWHNATAASLTPLEPWQTTFGSFGDANLQMVGYAVLWLPLTFAVWSGRYFLRPTRLWWQFRLSGLVATLLLTSLLCGMWSHPANTAKLWFYPGGAIGYLADRQLHGIGGYQLWFGLLALILLPAALFLTYALNPITIFTNIAQRASASQPAPPRRAKAKAEPEDVFEEPPARAKIVKPIKLTKIPKLAAPANDEPAPLPHRIKAAVIEEQLEIDGFIMPSLDLMQRPDPSKIALISREQLNENAEQLMGVLEEFGVNGEIADVQPGPVVALYELQPAPGIKSARVIGLADDIARSMSALSARVAVVPGRNVIGIELPNQNRNTVYLRELLESEDFRDHAGKLALTLGKDIGGGPVIVDLAKMPHLLIAGTTGSGKSVGVNAMILSLLYRLSPAQCRLIMIDPKMLELSVYDDIPHLLTPVVTDPKKAIVALKWVVREMEDRYRNMSRLGVRNIDGYNVRLKEARESGEVLSRKVQTGFDPDTGKPIFEEQAIDLNELPYIVVVVDEFADLMLVAGKEVEGAIQRLAQMARAAGIHLIMATQRPSVDVITGTIKANFPTRISFMVTSKIDSRTILGEGGAEQLLGQGDMLYMATGGRITRVHGPFVRDDEVEKVVRQLKENGPPEYIEAVLYNEEEEGEEGGQDDGEREANDPLFDKAVDLIARERKASTSFLQRHLAIGYNRAARIIDQMERDGMISAANATGKREILLRDAG